MTRKEYIRQLAQEIIRTNQPLIDRIVNQEVDKIKAQLASLAPNMAAMRSEMLAVMGSNSALACYLKKLMNWLALNLTSPQTHSLRHRRHQIREIILTGTWMSLLANISTVTIWSIKVSVNISMAATSLIAA